MVSAHIDRNSADAFNGFLKLKLYKDEKCNKNDGQDKIKIKIIIKRMQVHVHTSMNS